MCGITRADQEGGGGGGGWGGAGGPDPRGKSQVIWVSIGKKQLDPPVKSWTLSLENVPTPLEPWQIIVITGLL